MGSADVVAQSGWRQDVALYFHPRLLGVFLLGFSSGLPLALTAGTLALWLTEARVDKTTIGLFALAGTPYTFKFLWSPLIDQLPLPGLTRLLGRRRSWLLLLQFGLMLAILALGGADPAVDPSRTALLALLVAFFSASQDIVIDAFRVELLQPRQYGAGAAMVVLGYRVGMLASGAGALYLATWYGWATTYLVMAGLMSVGMLTAWWLPEPEVKEVAASPREGASRRERLLAWGQRAVVEPFRDFMNRRGWLWILLFILLFKFGDALAGVMTGPFLVEIGFTKITIANVTKVFGLAATLLGSVAGGVLVNRLGILSALLWCGLLQMLSNLVFVGLAWWGAGQTEWLVAAIAAENLAGGMGTAAFVAYLSALCNQAFTATQYALLSSFMSFGRTLLASSGGWMASQMSWAGFFLGTTVA
ncbi:MAG: AmpG family muropeptide MFS transporter, partial [Magnetococcales bacterium]|nr:AmpG family muropeptide MFS transporter [Magnetococcales bacterium]